MDPATAFVFRGVVAANCILGVESLGKRARFVLTLSIAVGALILSRVFNGGPLWSIHQLAVVVVVVLAVLESLFILWCAKLYNVAAWPGSSAKYLSNSNDNGSTNGGEHDAALTPRAETSTASVRTTPSMSPLDLMYSIFCVVHVLVFVPHVWSSLPIIDLTIALVGPVVIGEIICVSATGYTNKGVASVRHLLVARVVHICFALQWGFYVLSLVAALAFDDSVSSAEWTAHTGIGRAIAQLLLFPMAVAFGMAANAVVGRVVFA